MSKPLKAAIIGASGIGKHHAKWYHLLGCDVVAFVGSSPQSVERTAATLRGTFPFSGTGYTDPGEMLGQARPNLVSVCSPPHRHKEHVLAAVAAGCHVMCEKPLAWYEGQPGRDPLADAAEMLQAVQRAGVLGAVNTQYAAAIEPYRRLCEQSGCSAEVAQVRAVQMQMDSRGRGGKAVGEQIWIDLASHPLSVVQAFCGPGAIVASSARCRIEDKRVEATFAYAAAGREPVAATIIVRNVPQGPLVRRLGVNGVLADYDARSDDRGGFCAYLSRGEHEVRTTDFMQESLTRFVRAALGEGQPLMSFAGGVINLQMQAELLRAGRT